MTKGEKKVINSVEDCLGPQKRLLKILFAIVILCACFVLLYLVYHNLTDEFNYLGTFESPSILGHYENYAVSTDAWPCAKIGSALLEKGGSAVDAAIGTLICMGVVLPNSLGLGGGCLMTIYDAKSRKAITINGREVAPDYATEDMFVNGTFSSSRGPLSIGVPGELAAYWDAHQLYGRRNWSELFDRSIDLAENGHQVVGHLAAALRDPRHARYLTKPLAQVFLNTTTGNYVAEGETLYQKQIAQTLRRIRDHGAREFYDGLTGQLFIDDLQKQGGRMTLEDLKRYKTVISPPLEVNLARDLKLYTQPIPGSGIVLSIILRIMKNLGYYKSLRPQESFGESSSFYHRLVEAFKYGYAQRAGLEDMPDDPERMQTLMNKLVSEEFINHAVENMDNAAHSDDRYEDGGHFFKDDHGTAHVSVLDGDGNAVSVTTSVNLYFGSGLYSPSTGVIYNDIMDDFVSPNITNKFGLPPSNYNRIRPGKRPLSSMAPSIFVDNNGKVRLVIGASGGTHITTGIASVSIRNIFLGDDIKTAIDARRVHHQYLPNRVIHEREFPDELAQSLKSRGHEVRQLTGRPSIVMAIANQPQANGTNHITANSDFRKGGTVSGA